MSRHSLAMVASTQEARTAASPAETEADGEFSISDLARDFGVTLRTLRFYESRGLLAPARSGMTRIYSARDRARLALILKGKQLGFTLTEIRAMLAEDRLSDGIAANLNLSLDQVEDQISHLEQQKTEIEEALVELKACRARLTTAAA